MLLFKLFISKNSRCMFESFRVHHFFFDNDSSVVRKRSVVARSSDYVLLHNPIGINTVIVFFQLRIDF